MNEQTAKILCKMNNDFYRDNCSSFSATRHSPWEGWQECLQLINVETSSELSVFDLACGNLRFEAFLAERFPAIKFDFFAVDNCEDLVPEMQEVHYQDLDVVDALFRDGSLEDFLEAPTCDLAVSFGFMHHVPLIEQRKKVLEALVEKTKPGGYVVVSFWQFLNNVDLAKKAHLVNEKALKELGLPKLDEGDYILGWKDLAGQYRYCHNFSSTEIDRLAQFAEHKASIFSRFKADGRTNNLNEYLILKVH